MRKLLLFLVLVAFGIVLIVPGLIGWGVASRAPAALSQLGKALGDVQISNIRVSRGWFTSKIVFDALRSGSTARFETGLTHGPWTGLPPAVLTGRVLGNTVDDTVVSGHFRVSVRGNVTGVVRPGGKYGGGEARFALIDLGQELTVDADALRLADAIDALTGQLRFWREGPSDRVTGAFEADSLLLTTLRLREARMDLAVTRTGDNLSISIDSEAGDAADMGDPWRALELAVTMERLHVPTLQNLMRGLRAVGSATGTPEARRDVAGGVVISALPALMFNQPAMPRFRFSGRAPVGTFDVEGEARITAPPPPGFVADFSQLADVFEASGSSRLGRGTVDMLIDRRLEAVFGPLESEEKTRMRMMTLRDYLDAGLLRPEEGDFVSEFSYSSGSLTVNGAPAGFPANP